jgi:DNA-binding beta-propeller fold protein YncE
MKNNRVSDVLRIVLLMCLASAVFVACGPASRRNASLSAVQIAVQRLNGETSKAEPLSPGQRLTVYEGDGVSINQSGYAKLDMAKCILDIYRDSALHVKGVPSESAPVCIVAFEHGTLLASVSVKTVVDAEWAIITAVGTQFFVHRDLQRQLVWLVVIQGTVVFEAAGERIEVGPGQQVWVQHGSAPHQVGPANRAYVQDLFPRIEDLTTGILTDWQVLSDQRVVEGAATATATPAVRPTSTPTALLAAVATPTPTSAQTTRTTNTPAVALANTPTNTRTPLPSLPSATPGPQLGPQNVAVYYETGNVWVTYRLANAVAELDGENPDKVLRTIKGIDSPNGIVIWQAGGRAYVTNRDKGALTEIDLKSGKVLQTLAIDQPGAAAQRALPFGVAVDESNGDLYVANYGTSTLWYYNADARKATTMKWPERPVHAAFTLATDTTWVLSSNGIVRSIFKGDAGQFYEIAKGAFDLAIADDGLGGYATNPETKQVVAWGEGVKGELALKNAPYAIANMGGCIGVVVPAENALYTLDLGLSKILDVYKLGKQSVGDGGQGIAANHRTDMVYVTNYAADSVTAISSPCPR